jgi:hypothetical protein
VRRFERISGHSLTSTESLAEVWLALRATAAVPHAASRPAPAQAAMIHNDWRSLAAEPAAGRRRGHLAWNGARGHVGTIRG